MQDEISGDRIGELQRQLAQLRMVLVVSSLVWFATLVWLAVRQPPIPPVLAVERLEIVEADGTPALVMANSQRPAAATIDGQVIMEGQDDERRGVPSIIFFDGKGDEVGGMLFGVRGTPDRYGAIRFLSLDAYKQDQTVVLSHVQDPGGSTSGLTISDRPSHSLLDALAQLGLEPGASRERLSAAIDAIPEEDRAARRRELFGVTRAFFGTARGKESKLELKDGEGRVRIVIQVPDSGAPSIEILNEEGRVVSRLPG